MILERLAWEPRTSLRAGLEETYRWVYDQVAARRRGDHRPVMAGAGPE
jgi:hypothetical protein